MAQLGMFRKFCSSVLLPVLRTIFIQPSVRCVAFPATELPGCERRHKASRPRLGIATHMPRLGTAISHRMINFISYLSSRTTEGCLRVQLLRTAVERLERLLVALEEEVLVDVPARVLDLVGGVLPCRHGEDLVEFFEGEFCKEKIKVSE